LHARVQRAARCSLSDRRFARKALSRFSSVHLILIRFFSVPFFGTPDLWILNFGIPVARDKERFDKGPGVYQAHMSPADKHLLKAEFD
jgi:hypothetical protein